MSRSGGCCGARGRVGPSREGVGNGEPWIKARVTPVLVIEMSRKSLGGWRAKYSRGWQKDVSAQGDGEPHVLGTAVATFCQKMGQSGKRTKQALRIRLISSFAEKPRMILVL